MEQDDKLFKLKNLRHKKFMDSFYKIDESIKKIYSFLTGGGMAELGIESEGDPYESGLRF